jgi:hypothetical protein
LLRTCALLVIRVKMALRTLDAKEIPLVDP